MSHGWERVKNQCGLWKEENLIEFSGERQMEAGSGVRTHAGTAAPRGYKHKQSRRYLGFSTKRDVTLMRKSQVGWEPRAEEELNRFQVHGRHFRQETPGSVSEAGSSQGQAIHLQPDFCTVLCLRPTQPWVYSHLRSSFIPAFSVGCPPFRTSGLAHSPLLSRLNSESRCWTRPFGITCSHDASCCLSRAAVNTVTTHFTLRICV